MLERIDCNDTSGARNVKHVIQNNELLQEINTCHGILEQSLWYTSIIYSIIA